jgi:phage tail-like protein
MANPYTNDLSSHLLASDPLRNFKFLVQFNPVTGAKNNISVPAIGFMTISGLNVTTESIEYREGGYNTAAHQIPGMTSFSPVTFTRGVTLGSNNNHRWMKRLFSVSTDTAAGGHAGGLQDNFRYNVDISVLGHPNPSGFQNAPASAIGDGVTATSPENLFVAMRFRLYNAWIRSLMYSDLSAGSNGLLVESMTLVHEGLDIRWSTAADGYLSAPSFD